MSRQRRSQRNGNLPRLTPAQIAALEKGRQKRRYQARKTEKLPSAS